MAQKDIQDIANYMKQLDESIAEEEKACQEACKEFDECQALEDAEFEDEVIDKASMGFIDDDDQQDESDEFYAEDDDAIFEEDVSDCMEQEVEEAENLGSIEVEVYNEDGFGNQFAQDVSTNVPGVDAVVKKNLPNGDILVKISGSQDDLKKAFAWYLGRKSYAELSQDDKDDFESRLVFDDGDTLAEADYREAVAHCLDPIGVKASTANLVSKNTCKFSMIKEEKLHRKAANIMKALQEEDLSKLSDEDIETIDDIQDAIENHEDVELKDAEDERLWELILKSMGYTKEEWEKLSPEEREKIWNAANEPMSNFASKTGFAKYLTDPKYLKKTMGVDPGTDKPIRYTLSHEVPDIENGGRIVTQFNPDYDQEHSMQQHPAAAKKQMKKNAAALDQANREGQAAAAMRNARGKDTWDIQDFATIISALDGKERKALMNQLISDVEKDHPGDPRAAGNEIMFIKKLFGKKLTLRDFAKAWNASAPGVMKYADETFGIWVKTMRDCGITSKAQFLNMPEAKFRAFIDALKKNMEGRRKGSIVTGK